MVNVASAVAIFIVFIATAGGYDCCVWRAEKVPISNTTCEKGCPPGVPCFMRVVGECCEGVCIGKYPETYLCAASDSPNVTLNHQTPCVGNETVNTRR